jgi:FkbM family methyltransferase
MFHRIQNKIYWEINKHKKKLKYALAQVEAKDGFVIREIQGSKMLLNINDPGISKELIETGFHEKPTTELSKKEIHPGMVAIDIGANLGYYCLLESRLAGPNGKIYAIEPVPANFEALKRNIELNGYQNIETHCLAISDKSGKAEFLTTDASNWGTMVDLESDAIAGDMKERLKDIGEQTIEVTTKTLDEFVEENNIKAVNFMRMDIEGFEVNALRGMRKTLQNSPSPLKLMIEVHNKFFDDIEKDLLPAFQELFDMGFKVKVLIARGTFHHDPENDEFLRLTKKYNTMCTHVLFYK